MAATATLTRFEFEGVTIETPDFTPDEFAKKIAVARRAKLTIERAAAPRTWLIGTPTGRSFPVSVWGCVGCDREGQTRVPCSHVAAVLYLDALVRSGRPARLTPRPARSVRVRCEPARPRPRDAPAPPARVIVVSLKPGTPELGRALDVLRRAGFAPAEIQHFTDDLDKWRHLRRQPNRQRDIADVRREIGQWQMLIDRITDEGKRT